MYSSALLLAFVACAYASSVGPYDQCYREGDIVLNRYNKCKYRQCARVVPENGYGHLELEDKDCPEGTGVPYFLFQQYMHGVYAGHRFIGSHLASTVCGDRAVKRCEVSYGHPGVYGGAYAGHNGVYRGGYHGAYYGGYPRPYYQQTPTYRVKESEESASTESEAEESAASAPTGTGTGTGEGTE